MITRIFNFCTYHYAIAIAIKGAIQRVGETFGQAVYNWIGYPVGRTIPANKWIRGARVALILTLVTTGAVSGGVIGGIIGIIRNNIITMIIRNSVIGLVIGFIIGTCTSGSNNVARTATEHSGRMIEYVVHTKVVSYIRRPDIQCIYTAPCKKMVAT